MNPYPHKPHLHRQLRIAMVRQLAANAGFLEIGESEYPFCFSIRLMVLWQITKKHQNCVGGTAIKLPGINLPTHHISF
jgi:hypothetical protein